MAKILALSGCCSACSTTTATTTAAQQVYQGDGPPTTDPDDPTIPALYTDLLDGVIYTWKVNTLSWG